MKNKAKCLYCGKEIRNKKEGTIFCSRHCQNTSWNKANENKVKKSYQDFIKSNPDYYINRYAKIIQENPLYFKYCPSRNNPQKKKEYNLKKHIYEKQNYPEKVKAWKTDYKKVKDKCEVCGSKYRLQFHHKDYIMRLGTTLCLKCHKNIHNLNKQGEKTNGRS